MGTFDGVVVTSGQLFQAPSLDSSQGTSQSVTGPLPSSSTSGGALQTLILLRGAREQGDGRYLMLCVALSRDGGLGYVALQSSLFLKQRNVGVGWVRGRRHREGETPST